MSINVSPAENAQAPCKMDVDLQKRPTTQNVYVAASASVSVRRRR